MHLVSVIHAHFGDCPVGEVPAVNVEKLVQTIKYAGAGTKMIAAENNKSFVQMIQPSAEADVNPHVKNVQVKKGCGTRAAK